MFQFCSTLFGRICAGFGIAPRHVCERVRSESRAGQNPLTYINLTAVHFSAECVFWETALSGQFTYICPRNWIAWAVATDHCKALLGTNGSGRKSRRALMKKILLGVVGLFALGAAPALAADLPARTYPAKAPAMIAAIYDWSGFYIGLNGGGGETHKCWDVNNVL